MRTWLEHGDVVIEDPEPGAVAPLVASGIPFWLDIEGPTDAVIDQMADHLGLHALAVEDSKRFDQRGKLVVYGDVAMMIGFGIDAETGEPVEVHCYITAGFIVTFHRQRSDALDDLHRTGSLRALLGHDPLRVLHHAVTALHDPYGPYIEGLEDRLGMVEQEMVGEPRDDHLVEIARIRRSADTLRRTLTPGRDVAARMTVVMSLPGASDDTLLYANDVLDELRLIVADLAAVSDRCLGLLGLHASFASNRQNAASRQLAAVATVFLPITFVVGFFGMNFDVLTDDVEQGWLAFLLLGVLLNVACVVVTQWWLRRRGWG
jgi:magnesium transporter